MRGAGRRVLVAPQAGCNQRKTTKMCTASGWSGNTNPLLTGTHNDAIERPRSPAPMIPSSNAPSPPRPAYEEVLVDVPGQSIPPPKGLIQERGCLEEGSPFRLSILRESLSSQLNGPAQARPCALISANRDAPIPETFRRSSKEK